MSLVILMMTLNFLFPFMKHPLSMGIILILQTLLIVLMSGMIIHTFWFSYIMFLMILGGGLIMFIYIMASIASNEKINMIKFMPMYLTIILLLILLLSMTPTKTYLDFKYSNIFQLSHDQLTSLTKLFDWSHMPLTLFMIFYLLVTMIIVNYIVKIYDGPMRKKN